MKRRKLGERKRKGKKKRKKKERKKTDTCNGFDAKVWGERRTKR